MFLKKISTKVVFIFLLITIALITTITTSYIASDTLEQHLFLTDVLGTRQNVESNLLNNVEHLGNLLIAEASEEKINKIKDRVKIGVSKNKEIIQMLEDQNVKIDGDIYDLKFRDDFKKLFDKVLINTKKRFIDSNENINYFLSCEKSEMDEEKKRELEKNLNDFLMKKGMIVEGASRLIEICRQEAYEKKKLSQTIQIISILVSIGVLISLIIYIKKDFYNPIIEIKKTLKEMSKGVIDQKLKRKTEDEFKELYNEFNKFNDSLKKIFMLENEIIKENNIGEILKYIDYNFKSFIPFKKIGLEYQNNNNAIEKKEVTKGKYTKDIISNSDKDLKSFIEKAKKIKELILIEKTIYIPIKVGEKYLGHVYFEFSKDQEIKTQYRNFLNLIKDKMNFAFYKIFLVSDLLGIVTTSLGDLAEFKDPETGEHLHRMSEYSKVIATQLSKKEEYKDIINGDYIRNIKLSAPMHDIGKVGIPEKVLLKPGKLDDEEFKIIKRHPWIGTIVLNRLDKSFSKYGINYFEMAKKIAYGHHEKWDGSGYPRKISGGKIPLCGRIIALGDVFDALTSKRPYKEAFSLEKSYSIIRESSGSHFDPKVVEAFFEAQEEIEKIHEKINRRGE